MDSDATTALRAGLRPDDTRAQLGQAGAGRSTSADLATPSDPDDLCGVVLADRYRLLRILGRGAMGYVYVAQHVAIDKMIAVKVLGVQWARQSEFRRSFLVEAKATSRIRHDNVIEVHDFGETPNDSVFMAMELLRGEALSELIAREGALAWPRAKGIALQVCRALHCAHDLGVLHRDVKPENCFRTKRGANRDFIKLLDFGLAKIFGKEDDPHSSLTRAGAIFGTPEYMSPEQARGRPVDARTDVYASGVLLYELVTGQVPFSGATFMDVLTKQCTEPPPPPSVMAPHVGIPTELDLVILRALEKDVDARFQSMRELAEAIASVPLGPAVRTTNSGGTTGRRQVVPDLAAVKAPYVIAIATLCFVVVVLSIALAIAVLRP